MERNKKRKVFSKKKRKGIDEKDEYVVCDNVKILQSRTRSENTIRRNSNMHLNNLSHDTIQEQKLQQQKYTQSLQTCFHIPYWPLQTVPAAARQPRGEEPDVAHQDTLDWSSVLSLGRCPQVPSLPLTS